MKTKLFTKNSFLGLLMAFVLALGAQGIADGAHLPLSKTSGDLQTKSVTDGPFEIKFSIKERSNTTPIKDRNGKPVTDGRAIAEPSVDAGTAHRINNSGYLVQDVGSNEYRLPSSPRTDGFYRTSRSGAWIRATAGNGLLLIGKTDTKLYIQPTGEAKTYQVYAEDPDNTGAGDTSAPLTAEPQTKVPAINRYHYNEEAITISVMKDSGDSADAGAADAAMTFKLKASGFQNNIIRPIAEVPTGSLTKLPSSITLICTPTADTDAEKLGTYKIRITDSTDPTDTPWRTESNAPARAYIEFTLYVVDDSEDVTGIDVNEGKDNIFSPDETEQINTLFKLKGTSDSLPSTVPIQYSVVSGPGTVFEKTSQGDETPPSKYLVRSKQSNVFINLNNGNSVVRITVSGQDPNKKGELIAFTYTGEGARTTTTTSNQQNQQQNQQSQQQTTPNRLSISLSGSGDTRTVTVNALQAGTTSTSNIGVTLTVSGGSLSTTSGLTPLTSTWTLPSSAGTYTISVPASAGYTSDSESVTVTVPGTLTARQDGGTIVVTASPAPTSNLAFTLTTSTGIYAGQGSILTTGTGRAIPIVAAGSHILTVRADGYNPTQVSFTPGTQTTTDTTTPTTTTTTTPPSTGAAGVADSIEIDGARTLEGTVNQATRLRVRVLDATNRGVSGVRVTFRVLAPGQGRLSQRGNGRAVVAETDRSGYATASVTPLGGNLIVEAKAAGVTASVSFIIDVEGGTTPRETSDTTDERTYQVGDKVPISLQDTLTFRGSRTLNGTSYTCVGSGECVVSYGTLVKGEIAATAVPKVQAKTYKTGEKIPISLAATLTFSGKHTLGGTVYTCVSDGECVVSYGILTKGEIEVSTVSTPSAGDSPGMSDAKAVVGAANRPVMYWIAGGGLYRLAGASAEQLAARATDVAVGRDKLYWIEQTSETRGAIHHANLDGSDAAVIKTLTSVPKGVALANGKLYITNGWGKIQRMNVDGTQFETNFLTNLGAPLRIAVSGSRVYWTDGSGRVRSAPLQGTKAIQNIVTGSGMLGGIVADGSKVYWTEQTGARSGRVRAANLDGTGITNAYTVTATVHGLALDPANQQLYWTNGWGKVQRGVRGSRYQDVVTGLMTPTALAIGGANTATPMTATKPASTASEPNYDVDGSGTVDNADLFLVSLAVGTDNAQYDVNGDGTVNDKDIALVRDNRDNGAAAAPMVFGVKLTAEQVARLQEQIDLLIVSGNRSPDTLKTLVYLQQLIATARPEQTQLLANYPNPFNPETWIPYELATDTDVRITIYAANGVVVRTLQLGQQSAGYYTDRERAAYWDGRNASGEQVASGVYFYQLETDEISSLRKMVILK